MAAALVKDPDSTSESLEVNLVFPYLRAWIAPFWALEKTLFGTVIDVVSALELAVILAHFSFGYGSCDCCTKDSIVFWEPLVVCRYHSKFPSTSV